MKGLKTPVLLNVALIPILIVGSFLKSYSQNVNASWGANANSAWYTGSNWAANAYPGVQGVATTNANIATFTNAFTAITVGINMGTASLNLGAVSVDNTRTTAVHIGNSSAIPGLLRLCGAAVNGVANTIVSNNGSGLLMLQGNQNGAMDVVMSGLTDNIISTGSIGGITITAILSGNGSLTKTGAGTGVLSLTNTGNTYTGKTIINAGFINIPGEAALGTNPVSFVADQVTSNGGGIQATSANISFSSNRGLTLGPGGGSFDASNPFTISLQNPVAGSGDLTKFGTGTLQLNNPGGNTIPSTNNLNINAGTLQVSTNQTLNDLHLLNGTLVLDNNVTLTINGTFDYFQSGNITIGTGSSIVYGPNAVLKYSGATAKIATPAEFPALNGPATINCNNSGNVILPFNRTIRGSLALTAGTFIIGAGVLLDLDGASLSSEGGYIAGNLLTGSSADLMVRGTIGGTITLPSNGNIGLRNLTIDGTRTVALNGVNNLNLSGTLQIANTASFDNGGESQVIKDGPALIDIYGTFITRDREGFSGPNTSIPGIIPTLHAGCTVAYGRLGDQSISIRSDYQNLSFSGGGVKTHAAATSISPVSGTVTITDATILDVSNNSFGGTGTNLLMTDGRLRVSGIGTKPDIDGSYNLTGNSVIEFYNSGTAGNETIKGKDGLSADILYNRIEVTGNKVGNSNSNITLNSNGVFTVRSGGVFEMSDRVITTASATGGQSVVVEDGAVFLCGNNEGFNGFTSTFLSNSAIHANISNITLAQGSSVNYARLGDQPITNSNGIVYGNLILSGAGTKTAPSGNLEIVGDLVKTGTISFEANGGSVLLTGGAQLFAGLTYNNLLADNAGIKSLTGNAEILDSIRISNSFSDPNTTLVLGDNDVTLRSTKLKTAKVAILSPAAVINYNGTGRFVVERFYQALRAWRVITLPLTLKGTANGSIFETWQNNGVYSAGKGMFITGPGANNPLPGTNGLDWSDQNNYSVKRFSENKYIGMGQTKDSLVSGNVSDTSANIGYFAFVRGDRNRFPNNTVLPNTNETTLSGRGMLQVGRQTFHVNTDSVNSFTLIGNPYACPVDFNLVIKNNVYPNRFIAYDPAVNGVGVFVVMEDDGSGVFAPVNVPSTQNNFIQSGQAFFVQPLNAGIPADLVFNEYNKSVLENNLNLFRPVGFSRASLKTILAKRDDGNISVADGVAVQLDNSFSSGIDVQDALKFYNVAENLALMRHNKALSVEKRPVFTEHDTLFYRLTKTTQRNYQFQFIAEAIEAPGLLAYLDDSYTEVPVLVDLSGTTTINFSINADAASAFPDRFKIIFKHIDGGALPITTGMLKVRKRNNVVTLDWSVENEKEGMKYFVQRSADGVKFTAVDTIAAEANNRSAYTWLDKNPFYGSNYYRILIIDKFGKMMYSNIAMIKTDRRPGSSLYPEMISGNILQLHFNNRSPGEYTISMNNIAGQTFVNTLLNYPGGSSVELIKVKAEVAAGIYYVTIKGPDRSTETVKFIIN